MTRLIVRTRLATSSQARNARLLSERLAAAHVHNLPERTMAPASRSLSNREAA